MRRRVVQEPTWRNPPGWLQIDGAGMRLTIETTTADHAPVLEPSLRRIA